MRAFCKYLCPHAGQLSMLLIICVALKMSSFAGKFIAQHDTIVLLSLCVFVLVFQMILLVTLQHRSNNNDHNNNIFAILCVLLLSSVTSIIEVFVVSRTAAAITSILWCITLSWFLVFNWEEISTKNAPGERETQIMIEYSCSVLVIVFIFYTFVFGLLNLS